MVSSSRIPGALPAVFGDHKRAGDQTGDQVHDRLALDGIRRCRPPRWPPGCSPPRTRPSVRGAAVRQRPAVRRTNRWLREESRGARPRRVAHRPARGIGDRDAGGARPDSIAITRAAASSMASGTPSRRWQTSTTARALLPVKAKSALTCRARSTNRLMASARRRRSMSSPGSPTASGGSAISCSPSIAMPSRLVASTTTPGHSRSMRVTSRATAPSTCSQLSSTNSSCFWDSISMRESSE